MSLCVFVTTILHRFQLCALLALLATNAWAQDSSLDALKQQLLPTPHKVTVQGKQIAVHSEALQIICLYPADEVPFDPLSPLVSSFGKNVKQADAKERAWIAVVCSSAAPASDDLLAASLKTAGALRSESYVLQTSPQDGQEKAPVARAPA